VRVAVVQRSPWQLLGVQELHPGIGVFVHPFTLSQVSFVQTLLSLQARGFGSVVQTYDKVSSRAHSDFKQGFAVVHERVDGHFGTVQ
jgi:hypothetical protein